MFNPAICLRMRRLAAVPTVSCEALLDLESLLQCAPVSNIGFVLQAQHRSLLSRGGADAKVAELQDHSIHTVSGTTEESSLAGAASRNQTEHMVELLARLLREHFGRLHASGTRKEAGDE